MVSKGGDMFSELIALSAILLAFFLSSSGIITTDTQAILTLIILITFFLSCKIDMIQK